MQEATRPHRGAKRFRLRAVAAVSAFGLVLVVIFGLAGRLPEWVPFSDELALDAPTGPDVSYPVFGSEDLSLYLARNMVAQEPVFDVAYWAWATGDTEAFVRDAMLEVSTQNPYVFVSGWSYSIEGSKIEVVPTYTYGDDEAERRRQETRSAVLSIAAALGLAGLPDAEAQASAIHQYIATHATYDYAVLPLIEAGSTPVTELAIAQSQEAYGILVEGTAVCNGYAQAFQLLAQEAGLESVIVTGLAESTDYSSNHAWNRVLIDGSWHVVDVTWDDPGMTIDDPAWSDDYLLLSLNDPLLATRTPDEGWAIDAQLTTFGG